MKNFFNKIINKDKNNQKKIEKQKKRILKFLKKSMNNILMVYKKF